VAASLTRIGGSLRTLVRAGALHRGLSR
jgi:hypothetical protein